MKDPFYKEEEKMAASETILVESRTEERKS